MNAPQKERFYVWVRNHNSDYSFAIEIPEGYYPHTIARGDHVSLPQKIVRLSPAAIEIAVEGVMRPYQSGVKSSFEETKATIFYNSFVAADATREALSTDGAMKPQTVDERHKAIEAELIAARLATRRAIYRRG